MPRGNQISSNLFFQVKRILNGQPAWAEWSNNYITNLNPGFKDPDDPIKDFYRMAVYKYIYDFSPLPLKRWDVVCRKTGPNALTRQTLSTWRLCSVEIRSFLSVFRHFVGEPFCLVRFGYPGGRGWKILSVLFCHGVGNRTSAFCRCLAVRVEDRGRCFRFSIMGDTKILVLSIIRTAILRARSSWDAQTVSNTHIKRFNGKYYLYYCGSVDPGENARIKGTLSKRGRIQQNQKLGVLCFNSIKDLLEGKYTCNEQPLLIPRSRVKPNNVLEPSPEGTAVKPDNLIMVNPAVVYCPANRKYFLYFKGNVYDPGWRGVHGVAISSEPAGPFRVLDDNVFGGNRYGSEIECRRPVCLVSPQRPMFLCCLQRFYLIYELSRSGYHVFKRRPSLGIARALFIYEQGDYPEEWRTCRCARTHVSNVPNCF